MSQNPTEKDAMLLPQLTNEELEGLWKVKYPAFSPTDFPKESYSTLLQAKERNYKDLAFRKIKSRRDIRNAWSKPT